MKSPKKFPATNLNQQKCQILLLRFSQSFFILLSIRFDRGRKVGPYKVDGCLGPHLLAKNDQVASWACVNLWIWHSVTYYWETSQNVEWDNLNARHTRPCEWGCRVTVYQTNSQNGECEIGVRANRNSFKTAIKNDFRHAYINLSIVGGQISQNARNYSIEKSVDKPWAL